MAKIAEGAALAAGAAAAFVVAPYLAPLIITNSLLASAVFGIGATGLAMTFGGIEQALRGNQAVDVSTRQPAQPRQVIYGVSRVAATYVGMWTTGNSKDYLNTAPVWAGHPCEKIAELYVDSRLVHFSDHGGAWGNASGDTFRDDSNNQYSFGGLYMEPRLGPMNAYMSSLGANVPQWTPDMLGNGCCWSYIKYTYNVSKYPNGTPNPRATIWGKNTIYDPRTGTTGWSNNAALCIADFLCDKQYGFGFNMQEDIDLDQLVAAANICDEQVPLAAGGTESRYTINGAFDASTAPGDVLASMLDAMGGRISYVGGKVKLYPAAWIGPTLAFDKSDLVDAVSWSPRRKFRDMVNAVKGTYIAPNYPYSVFGNYYGSNGKDASGSTQNNFQYEWQPTDFPAYTQDADHGYAINQPLLNANGIELWSDLRLQFVTSAATAQRLGKIKLMRNQQQGSGTLPFNLGAYQCEPLEVIQFSFEPLQMADQALEISNLRLANKADDDGNVSLHVETDVQQTDISVYEWSTSEELTPAGSVSPQLNDAGFVSTPMAPTIKDNITTAYVGADGVVQPRLSVAWALPTDGSSAFWNGVQVQFQLNGWNAWQDAGTVDAASTSTLVSGVSAGQLYNVRIRAVKANGAVSAWVVAGSYSVSNTYSQVNSRGLAPGLVAASVNDATIDSVVSGASATVRVYGAGGIGTAYTQAIGSVTLTLPAASLTGQGFSTNYTLLWNTVTSTYLLTTGVAPSDDYVLIGALTTVASGGTGGTGGGGGGGVYTCTVRGTKLISDRCEESNEVIKARFDAGEPTYLIGRYGSERIVSAEWVPIDHYQRIEVEGFRPFGCSDTHTLLPEGSDRHIWCSAIEPGTKVDTVKGFAAMNRTSMDTPAEVLKIELAGPSHEYLVEDGVWSHNVKPLSPP